MVVYRFGLPDTARRKLPMPDFMHGFSYNFNDLRVKSSQTKSSYSCVCVCLKHVVSCCVKRNFEMQGAEMIVRSPFEPLLCAMAGHGYTPPEGVCQWQVSVSAPRSFGRKFHGAMPSHLGTSPLVDEMS